MDGVTLTNLDVLLNSSAATTEGTLLHCLQHCYTPFGLCYIDINMQCSNILVIYYTAVFQPLQALSCTVCNIATWQPKSMQRHIYHELLLTLHGIFFFFIGFLPNGRLVTICSASTFYLQPFSLCSHHL